MKIFTSWKRNLIILLLLWTVVQIFLFYYTGGLQVVIDSERYLHYASSFRNTGFDAFGSFYSYQYLSYIVVLALILEAGGSLFIVVFIQLLFSGLSTLALYLSSYIISQSHRASFFSCCLFVLWLELQSWNYYILTESLFINLGVISFYFILKTRQNVSYSLVLIPLLLITIFVRPHGIIYLLATAVFILSSLKQSKKYRQNKKPLISLSIILSFFLLFLTSLAVADFMSVEAYITGDVVFMASVFAPDSGFLSIDTATLTKPNSALPTLFQLLQFIYLNPLYFVKLSLAKLFFFFAHVKPYYSQLHNLLIVLTLYPIYYLFIRGLKEINRTPSKSFSIALVMLQAASVMLTTEDWDGRFLMPVLPYMMIFAAIGLDFSLNGIKEKPFFNPIDRCYNLFSKFHKR